nr:DUF1549 domain-containing protein [Roseimaritima ulvae]
MATLIDRLLASPQYGEKWGRHWLDVVRYADTAGENTDRPLPHAWRYRNWVIDAFNRDLAFDDFVRLQLAGDLVRHDQPTAAYREGVIATGYLAIARRFGHDIDNDIHLMYEDVIDNVGKNFLGLSVGCARCHDHKYDPVAVCRRWIHDLSRHHAATAGRCGRNIGAATASLSGQSQTGDLSVYDRRRVPRRYV